MTAYTVLVRNAADEAELNKLKQADPTLNVTVVNEPTPVTTTVADLAGILLSGYNLDENKS